MLRSGPGRSAGTRLECAQGRAAGTLALLLTLVVFLACGGARAAPTFPPLTGRVVDDAHVLSPDVQAQLTQELADLEMKTGRQLVVVTLPSLQGYDIADYGYQLGRAWGIGQKGKDNGALFIVAPNDKKVRIEVGYGLEGELTDAISSVILNTRVLPKFKVGDMQGGIVDGTNALVQQLGLDPDQAQAAAQQAEQQQAQLAQSYGHRHARNPAGALISFLIFFFVMSAFFRGGRRGGGLGWVLPLMFLSGMRGRGGGWGGDGGGGFGGGGFGGFSGGGGSFGGGGASGGW